MADKNTKLTITPEMREVTRKMVKAKLELWDHSLALEKLVGFDVDTAGDAIDSFAAQFDNPDDRISDDAIDELIREFEDEAR